MKKPKGISVLVKTKEEFDHVKHFLTEDVLYLDWHENMLTRDTAIVLKANKRSDYSAGNVGCAKSQASFGIKVLPFKKDLVRYLIE